MGLTLLAIPFLLFGVFVKAYDEAGLRCIGTGNSKYCFEQGSQMPDFIKYGSVAVAFGLLYAGRRQIKRRRGN